MKVAVIGSTGQLGSDLMIELEKSGKETVGLSHKDLSVEDYSEVSKVLREIKPDVVINTAAFHNVEKCEEKPDKAFLVNAIGARNVAVACERIGCDVVYTSTDYVFDGEKKSPYIEFDDPNPLNVYGKSKLAGENETMSLTSRYYIVRTAWLYGKNYSKSKGGNFVTKIIKLAKEKGKIKVVNDQFGTPTNTRFLAKQIVKLIETKAYGRYHITCQGQASWYEFATEIIKNAGIKADVIPVKSDEFPTKAKRPKYSVLENFALKALGIDIMPHWREALKEFFKEV